MIPSSAVSYSIAQSCHRGSGLILRSDTVTTDFIQTNWGIDISRVSSAHRWPAYSGIQYDDDEPVIRIRQVVGLELLVSSPQAPSSEPLALPSCCWRPLLNGLKKMSKMASLSSYSAPGWISSLLLASACSSLRLQQADQQSDRLG